MRFKRDVTTYVRIFPKSVSRHLAQSYLITQMCNHLWSFKDVSCPGELSRNSKTWNALFHNQVSDVNKLHSEINFSRKRFGVILTISACFCSMKYTCTWHTLTCDKNIRHAIAINNPIALYETDNPYGLESCKDFWLIFMNGW